VEIRHFAFTLNSPPSPLLRNDFEYAFDLMKKRGGMIIAIFNEGFK
jgi:hypothetical protein